MTNSPSLPRPPPPLHCRTPSCPRSSPFLMVVVTANMRYIYMRVMNVMIMKETSIPCTSPCHGTGLCSKFKMVMFLMIVDKCEN